MKLFEAADECVCKLTGPYYRRALAENLSLCVWSKNSVPGLCSLRPLLHRGKLIHVEGLTFYPGGGRGK